MFAGGMDPAGGAGLIADVKTAAYMGFHGCPVVTALTVQNSGDVLKWDAVEPQMVTDQAEAVIDDGPVAAVKTGMLGTIGNVTALSSLIRERLSGIPFILDPVLCAGGGSGLSENGISAEISRKLLPLATVCTPNLREAAILSGSSVFSSSDMEKAAQAMIDQGCGAVLLKGGHLPGEPADLLAVGSKLVWFHGSRIPGGNVHGTGCTTGAALASFLAAGFPLETAVQASRTYVRSIISGSLQRVHGLLPGHFPQASGRTPGGDSESFYLPPRFCGRCGSPLEQEVGGRGHLQCPSCGGVHYRNPLPAVTLLVHDEGKLLLVRRAVEPMKGMLSLPGGFMETGETPLECGARELLEETGLQIIRADLLDVESDDTPYGGILLAAYEVTEWSGIPVAGDDASDLFWADITDIPGLAFRAHDRLVLKLLDYLD